MTKLIVKGLGHKYHQSKKQLSGLGPKCETLFFKLLDCMSSERNRLE